MSNDIAIGSVTIPSGAPISKKPPYLITLEDNNGKTRAFQSFISLDKPESINGLVQVKGFFCDKDPGKIIKTFADIIANNPKEDIMEIMFPLHRIYSIRSLVFNAVKTVTVK